MYKKKQSEVRQELHIYIYQCFCFKHLQIDIGNNGRFQKEK